MFRVKVLTSQMPLLRQIFQVGNQSLLNFPWNFNSDGGQCDFVRKLKKSLYGQAEATQLWDEKSQNVLLERGL